MTSETQFDQDAIRKSLHEQVCKLVFTKANGDTRIMHATLKEDLLPEQIDVEEHIQKKKPNPSVLAVWDVDAKGWRSFRWDSLKDFNTEFNV